MATTDFIIDTDRGPRGILTVKEGRGGDLLLLFRAKQLTRENGRSIWLESADPSHRRMTKQMRVSVHPSDKSPLGVTTIKTTTEVDGSPTRTNSVASIALKLENKFAHVMSGRATRLLGPTWDPLPTPDRAIQLCSMDTRKFTYFFSVYVGLPNRRFQALPRFERISLVQTPFSRFNLVILQTFLSAPSHESGSFDSIWAIRQSLLSGRNESSCYAFSKETWTRERDELLRTFESDPDLHPFLPFYGMSKFVRNPSITSREYKAFLKELERAGATLKPQFQRR